MVSGEKLRSKALLCYTQIHAIMNHATTRLGCSKTEALTRFIQISGITQAEELITHTKLPTWIPSSLARAGALTRLSDTPSPPP